MVLTNSANISNIRLLSMYSKLSPKPKPTFTTNAYSMNSENNASVGTAYINMFNQNASSNETPLLYIPSTANASGAPANASGVPASAS